MEGCKNCQHYAIRQKARPANFMEIFCRKDRKMNRPGCSEFKKRNDPN